MYCTYVVVTEAWLWLIGKRAERHTFYLYCHLPRDNWMQLMACFDFTSSYVASWWSCTLRAVSVNVFDCIVQKHTQRQNLGFHSVWPHSDKPRSLEPRPLSRCPSSRIPLSRCPYSRYPFGRCPLSRIPFSRCFFACSFTSTTLISVLYLDIIIHSDHTAAIPYHISLKCLCYCN